MQGSPSRFRLPLWHLVSGWRPSELSDEEKEEKQASEVNQAEEYQRRLNCISSLPFFDGMSKDATARLAQTLEEEHYSAGDVLCTRNDFADKAFFLVEGRANVLGGPVDSNIVFTLKHSKEHGALAGKSCPFFGEMVSLVNTTLSLIPSVCL